MIEVKKGQVWEFHDIYFDYRFYIKQIDQWAALCTCYSWSCPKNVSYYTPDYDAGDDYVFSRDSIADDIDWELILDYGADPATSTASGAPTCTKCNTVNEYVEHDAADGPYVCYKCKCGF